MANPRLIKRAKKNILMQLFGHRGAAGEAPENTIAAAKHAISRGVRAVEIDLRISADGKLVVTHDKNTKRTAGVNRLVANSTSQQLSQLDSRLHGPIWSNKVNCGIPTLQRYLKHSEKINCYQLEIKTDSPREHRHFVRLLLEAFPNKSSAKQVVITSFDYILLEKIATHLPHVKIGAITYKPAAIDIAKSLECDFFCINESLANKSYLAKIRKTKMHVSVWTVNDPALIKTLYDLGVDSIISDYPSMAIPLISRLSRKN